MHWISPRRIQVERNRKIFIIRRIHAWRNLIESYKAESTPHWITLCILSLAWDCIHLQAWRGGCTDSLLAGDVLKAMVCMYVCESEGELADASCYKLITSLKRHVCVHLLKCTHTIALYPCVVELLRNLLQKHSQFAHRIHIVLPQFIMACVEQIFIFLIL